MAGGLRPTRFLGPNEIAAVVARLAGEISRDHPDGVVLVGLLKDSTIFLADLVRAVEVPCVVDFLALSAYASGERRVRVMKDLDADLSGESVVLVRDIVDTGLSVRYALDLLADRGARSVRLCALLDRPDRRILPVGLDYVGTTTEAGFLVGYGLDLNERYRNLPALYRIDPSEFLADPEAGDLALFGVRGAVANGAPEG